MRIAEVVSGQTIKAAQALINAAEAGEVESMSVTPQDKCARRYFRRVFTPQ
jgi:hypothetical protein